MLLCQRIPGYDNHGLPIEQSVIAKYVERIKTEKKAGESATAKRLGLEGNINDGVVANALRSPQHLDEFRKACREHAAEEK